VQKPIAKKKAWPLLEGRLKTIAALLPECGVGHGHGKFPQDPVTVLIKEGFQAPKEECRHAALNAAIELLRCYGTEAERGPVVEALCEGMKPALKELVSHAGTPL